MRVVGRLCWRSAAKQHKSQTRVRAEYNVDMFARARGSRAAAACGTCAAQDRAVPWLEIKIHRTGRGNFQKNVRCGLNVCTRARANNEN